MKPTPYMKTGDEVKIKSRLNNKNFLPGKIIKIKWVGASCAAFAYPDWVLVLHEDDIVRKWAYEYLEPI